MYANKLNILISAFEFSPGYGSEAANGWHWTMQAARQHRVWVLVYPDIRRHEIECALRAVQHLDVSVVYWEVPLWPKQILPRGRKWMLYYVLWQLTVFPLAWWLHRRIRFDATHQLTINTIEAPGFLWLLNPPFFWGPVGGAQEPPSGFQRYFGKAWYKEILRLTRKKLVSFNPLVRMAVRKASAIIAANNDTEWLLRRCGAQNIIRSLDVGVALQSVPPIIERTNGEKLTVVWAGVLTPRKGAMLALDAIDEAIRRDVPMNVKIAGDGPLASQIRSQISELALTRTVHQLGRVPYSEMAKLYEDADVFLFTSLHDTSGTVILEAMAHGLPVVALDHHGVKEIVTNECGVRVTTENPDATVTELADALQYLYENPGTRRKMSGAARARVINRYVWELKEEVLKDMYSAAGGTGL